jgi:hypothetical protein
MTIAPEQKNFTRLKEEFIHDIRSFRGQKKVTETAKTKLSLQKTFHGDFQWHEVLSLLETTSNPSYSDILFEVTWNRITSKTFQDICLSI